MVEGQVFLKRTGREGGGQGWGLALFLFKFLFAELRYAFEAKLFFSATIILWKKKNHSKLSKNRPENIPPIKKTRSICKGV